MYRKTWDMEKSIVREVSCVLESRGETEEGD